MTEKKEPSSPLRPGLIGHGFGHGSVTVLVTDGSLPQSQSITKPTVDSDRFYE
jgi:hypothetical protein